MKTKSKRLTLTALFAIIIAFFAWISVPTPFGIPVTLQVFGVALCGYTLGLKWGLACTATYIIMGAIGLPVFSFFGGGLGVLTSANGGFIFGFLLLSVFCSLNTLCKLNFLMPCIGVLLCHAVGVLQFSLVSGANAGGVFLTASLPFIFKDFALVITAFYIRKRIRLEEIYD